MARRVLRILAFACAASLYAAAALPQDTPAVFVHGFNANGGDWQKTADRLAQELTITSHRITTNWKAPIPDQVAQLQADPVLGALQLPVLVGHSNGGLISREWSKTHPVSGIVTLGTPHLGAPVIYHLPEFIGFLFQEIITRAFTAVPAALSQDWHWIVAVVFEWLQYYYGIAADSILELGSTLLLKETIPVTAQMYPNAPYLRDNLNAVPNLNREAAEVPVRVGIVNVARNYFFAGPVRAWRPEIADEVAVVMYAGIIALEVYAYRIIATADPFDFEAFDFATNLLTLADRIFLIDPFWCMTVSTTEPVGPGRCVANDAVVPNYTQHYPVAGSFLLERSGPAHTQEKDGLHEAIATALTSFLPIYPRGGGPPPPPPPGGSCTASVAPASIDIQAAGGSRTINVVMSDASCGWTASSSSGWLAVDSPASGIGGGTITVVVDSNESSMPRSGTVTVAGQQVVFNQSGVGCSFELAPYSATVGRFSTAGSVAVSTTVPDCGWTATSNAAWLSVTGPASGTGSGTVQYAVAANSSGAPRTGTLSIAGRTFTVTQNGNAAPIGSIVKPLTESMFERGAAIEIEVTASDPDGSVTRVDFSVDDNVIGSDTTSPYTFTWSNATSGRHTLTATVYDDAGNSTTTAGVGIGVKSLDAVTVSPASLQAGQTASITVTGQDPCGALMFDYGDGRVIVYPITGLPYSRTAAWNSGGQKIVTIIGQGNCVGSVSTSVNVTGNLPPTVAVTSPSTGAAFLAPASISLTATASDPDGTIDRVEFYSGPILIGTATSPPYAVAWTGVASGSYTLTARAVDNAGAETVSSPVGVVVRDLDAITISPAAPKAGQTATVTVTGSPTCGAVGIDYGDGTAVVYALSGLPTTQTHTWTGPGVKTITATGHGNCQGQISTTVTIQPNASPAVELTAPAAGAAFVHPAAVTLTAQASDSDGAVTRVEFYAGTTLIGTDTTSPYSASWTAPVGTHSLTARAYDDTNGAATSPARSIQVSHVGTVSVSPAAIVAGQSATVTVNGSPGCGAIELDYGDGTVETYPLTGLPMSRSHTWTTASTKTVTATGQGSCVGQSSTTLTVAANPAPTVSLTAPAAGAAFTAPATITLQATASDAHGIAVVEFYAGSTLVGSDSSAPYSYTWSSVPYGTYSISARAVDAYGAAAASAAVSIAVRDIVSVSVAPSSLTAGAAGTVTVTGSSTCGAVEINYGDGFANTYAITGLPFSQSHVWATGGWKTITATGHGNCAGQASTSIYVNARPTVTLTSPINGDTFVGPASIQLAATAADADGSIQSVRFYANGALLATDSTAPYAFLWTNVGPGAYSFSAVAVDNAGAQASASASVSVVNPGPSKLTSLVVSPNPVAAGQAASVTVYGTNPCGAVQINFGDGQAPFIPISGVPYTASHVWAAPGTYTVTATGHGNCTGQVSTTVVVQ